MGPISWVRVGRRPRPLPKSAGRLQRAPSPSHFSFVRCAASLIAADANKHRSSVGSDNVDWEAIATDGICLDPASAAGGQGGSYESRDNVPVDAIYGYSTGGTTVTIFDGSDAGH
jgi:hypothetical protein